ncbi:MAG: T9SS type A sorting domain-containing protein [Chitinophagales bacterium]|jgi:hypothetical protein|nr:T9SS type A sorting domain-containing protein [Chitinophagales bacterium]
MNLKFSIFFFTLMLTIQSIGQSDYLLGVHNNRLYYYNLTTNQEDSATSQIIITPGYNNNANNISIGYSNFDSTYYYYSSNPMTSVTNMVGGAFSCNENRGGAPQITNVWKNNFLFEKDTAIYFMGNINGAFRTFKYHLMSKQVLPMNKVQINAQFNILENASHLLYHKKYSAIFCTRRPNFNQGEFVMIKPIILDTSYTSFAKQVATGTYNRGAVIHQDKDYILINQNNAENLTKFDITIDSASASIFVTDTIFKHLKTATFDQEKEIYYFKALNSVYKLDINSKAITKLGDFLGEQISLVKNKTLCKLSNSIVILVENKDNITYQIKNNSLILNEDFKNSQISLIDLQGKAVKESINSNIIDLNGVSNGSYFLCVIKNKKIITSRISLNLMQ